MIPKLKCKTRIPYGGMWQVQDPATGLWSKALLFRQLVEKVAEQRRVNGVPIGIGFEEEVEKWCCEYHPDECDNLDPALPRRRSMNLGDIVNGTRVMASFKLAGSPLVDKSEAERRAAICVKCPLNQSFSRPCSGLCPELRDLVVSLVGAGGTKFDSDLRACSICACYLEASIWMPLDIQCKGVTPTMRAQFSSIRQSHGCWKNCD